MMWRWEDWNALTDLLEERGAKSVLCQLLGSDLFPQINSVIDLGLLKRSLYACPIIILNQGFSALVGSIESLGQIILYWGRGLSRALWNV